jgi:hypothetical protein
LAAQQGGKFLLIQLPLPTSAAGLHTLFAHNDEASCAEGILMCLSKGERASGQTMNAKSAPLARLKNNNLDCFETKLRRRKLYGRSAKFVIIIKILKSQILLSVLSITKHKGHNIKQRRLFSTG